MSEAITVACPSCKASLKLKNRSAVGKRVPCPKCKKPFVVKAPAEEDDEMAFLNASESDAAMPVSEEDEEEAEAPVQPTLSSSRGSSRKKKGKGKAAPVNWLKPVLIGVGALAFVGLMVGGGMFAVSFISGLSKNKIDLSYLPPEADLIVHVRVDEMLASPFLQPLVAKPALKETLDKLSNELHVSLGDIKSVTLGVSGMSKVNYQKAFAMPGMPGMGIPGLGQPGAAMAGQPMPNIQNEFSQTRTVMVIRASKALPADLMTKVTGYESVTHQGTTYHRPAAAHLRSTQPALCLATPDILLVADEAEIHRIAEKGSKQVRRAEFDFMDTTPQIVIAMLNPSSGTSGAAAGTAPGGATPGAMPGGMPGMPGGGMPGMPGGGMGGPGMGGAGMGGGAPGLAGLANAQSLTNGKIKGWYVGISFTQDIEIQTGLNCPESAKEALADIDRELTKTKNEFPNQKAQLGMLAMFGMGDLVPHIESMVNSLNATGAGDVVKVNFKIPGGIAATIEKAVPTIMGMAGAGGNPFGGPPGGESPSDASSSEAPGGDDPAASQNPTGNP